MLILYIPYCDADVKPHTPPFIIGPGCSWNAFNAKEQTVLYLETKSPHLLSEKKNICYCLFWLFEKLKHGCILNC